MTDVVPAEVDEEQFRAWTRRDPPPVTEVRPGLWSIPVPTPAGISPPWTYSYVFDIGGRLFVVDPGWPAEESWNAFRAGLAWADLDVGAVEGVVVTHAHPDHVGLAAWLSRASGAWLGMHPAEAGSVPRDGRGPDGTVRWCGERGGPESEARAIVGELGGVRRLVAATPTANRLIEDGAEPFGPGTGARAVWTPGHTAGHLSIRHDEYDVLLTGDHVLPHISPNVSVHSDDRGDALGEYLHSLDVVAAYDTAEVLPGHEYRFHGIDARVRELAGHHADRLAEIRAVVQDGDRPSTWGVAAELSWSRGWEATTGGARLSAVAETYAHLIHLEWRGELRRDDEPVDAWYPVAG